jgi:hypothetical protein
LRGSTNLKGGMANQTVVFIPGRPINNRPQVNNLPHIAAKPRCATGAAPLEIVRSHDRWPILQMSLALSCYLAISRRQLMLGAVAAQAAKAARTYDIRDYGAKGDSATLDTAAVHAAIDACENDKGGTLLVPAGDFIVGNHRVEEQCHSASLSVRPAAGAWQSGTDPQTGGQETYSTGK